MGWKGKGAGVDGIIFSIFVASWSVGRGGRVGSRLSAEICLGELGLEYWMELVRRNLLGGAATKMGIEMS